MISAHRGSQAPWPGFACPIAGLTNLTAALGIGSHRNRVGRACPPRFSRRKRRSCRNQRHSPPPGRRRVRSFSRWLKQPRASGGTFTLRMKRIVRARAGCLNSSSDQGRMTRMLEEALNGFFRAHVRALFPAILLGLAESSRRSTPTMSKLSMATRSALVTGSRICA